MPSEIHKPVLLRESINYLNLKEGDCIVDATIGLGGHSEVILEKIGPKGILIGFDADSSNIEILKSKFSQHRNLILMNENFSQIETALKKINIFKINGILFDFGLSSFQLNSPNRGFSFQNEGPLDMRINQSQSLHAEKIINNCTKNELEEIFKKYGEEKHSKRISWQITESRKKENITSTLHLSKIINKALYKVSYNERRNILARIFQAIRIRVNNELDNIEKGLRSSIKLLSPGGRIVTISFHSLEDKIVKNTFNLYTGKYNNLYKKELILITKKVIVPDFEEIKYNSRAKSSKLRAAEKI